ncbi:hypothetical protein [Nocardia asteroides]|uniref:hypothetical protein n=1 Tax=Nocardia asteroides TaxID=1824 RepID=UPI001E6570B1|nr:hypothetical protein [Nocardia asteroides]UGT58833.1 hypothetical protein LTT85_33315 [Nocardia asteroides]
MAWPPVLLLAGDDAGEALSVFADAAGSKQGSGGGRPDFAHEPGVPGSTEHDDVAVQEAGCSGLVVQLFCGEVSESVVS